MVTGRYIGELGREKCSCSALRNSDRFSGCMKQNSPFSFAMYCSNSVAKQFRGAVHESTKEIWLKAKNGAVSRTGRATARIQREGEADVNANTLVLPIHH